MLATIRTTKGKKNVSPKGTTRKPFKPVTVAEAVELERLIENFSLYLEAKLGGPVARMYEDLWFAKSMMKWQDYPVELITPQGKQSISSSRRERERIAAFLKAQNIKR